MYLSVLKWRVRFVDQLLPEHECSYSAALRKACRKHGKHRTKVIVPRPYLVILVQVSTSIMCGSMVQHRLYFFFFPACDSELFVVWICKFCSSPYKWPKKLSITFVILQTFSSERFQEVEKPGFNFSVWCPDFHGLRREGS